MPGDAILNPVALVAIGALLANDHLGKVVWPGLVTGKLSDIAGLVFFPLLLLGAWELGLSALRRWSGPTVRPLLVAMAATGVAFALPALLVAPSIGLVRVKHHDQTSRPGPL